MFILLYRQRPRKIISERISTKNYMKLGIGLDWLRTDAKADFREHGEEL
jgi:hypothetical protein